MKLNTALDVIYMDYLKEKNLLEGFDLGQFICVIGTLRNFKNMIGAIHEVLSPLSVLEEDVLRISRTINHVKRCAIHNPTFDPALVTLTVHVTRNMKFLYLAGILEEHTRLQLTNELVEFWMMYLGLYHLLSYTKISLKEFHLFQPQRIDRYLDIKMELIDLKLELLASMKLLIERYWDSQSVPLGKAAVPVRWHLICSARSATCPSGVWGSRYFT
ncbi:hypothetical protein G9A89_010239 [Geosiphon pyriformis]|nr:hypothetical protein G9A89_010239 [Geosiphon pyriformis]